MEKLGMNNLAKYEQRHRQESKPTRQYAVQSCINILIIRLKFLTSNNCFTSWAPKAFWR